MRIVKYFFSLSFMLFFCFAFQNVKAQDTAVIKGIIINENQDYLGFASVNITNTVIGCTANGYGYYQLVVPSDTLLEINFSYMSNKTTKQVYLEKGEVKIINAKIIQDENILPRAEIHGRRNLGRNTFKLNPKNTQFLPTPNASIEDLIKSRGGVSSGSELSSQYSVRGGSYDENLVYVNGIEIYRPMLVGSGEQEGLSFLNPDLAESIMFSAGGFDAEYGDKLSSVLAIEYKRPTEFHASLGLSLLGVSTHVEGGTDSTAFYYMLGIRQKSNQYLLGSLDTKGDYKPSFTDIQGILGLDLGKNKKWNIEFLGDISRNIYQLIPTKRDTDFGNINEAYRLTVYYDGWEEDRFVTYTGALTTTYKPNKDLELKIITSVFNSNEEENIDIRGEYWIYQLESGLGDDDFGEEAFERGVGAFHNHARNELYTYIYNVEHKGKYIVDENMFDWGVKYQNQNVYDYINEWTLIDSSGYTLPYSSDSIGYTNPAAQQFNPLMLNSSVRAYNEIHVNRFSGFIQDQWNINRSKKLDTIQSGDSWDWRFSITGGVRFNYNDLNNELLISPRLALGYSPAWSRIVVFRLSGGYYAQPAFYREMRDLTGVLHTDTEAQKSVQVVGGVDWSFNAWRRPFKLTVEAYYKHLYNLVPYEINNVSIDYLADQTSHGFTTGIEFKINGDFVKGIESWASLTLMRSLEDIEGDYFYDYYNADGLLIKPGYTIDSYAVDSVGHEGGYVARPTDQRVMVNFFFQDYIPKFPTYKMHLNLVFATGLPLGPPDNARYKDTLRIPSYRRVDIGFSKMLKGENQVLKDNNPFRHFESIWVSVEIFNLIDIKNTISYLWITDVSNRMYAIPNYLTSRRINVKIQFKI